MEKLKSTVPQSLRNRIAHSTPNDLPSTCASLLNFLHNLPLFHTMIEDLADKERGVCGKNKNAALEFKHKANQLFSNQIDYAQALSLYSQALRVAPVDVYDGGRNLVASLYLNRASVFLKLGCLKECVRDCNRALRISPTYSKAWYRRGKANVSLGNYESAINDLNLALKTEPSSGGKRQIETELRINLDKYKTPRNSLVYDDEKSSCILGEPCSTKLLQVTSPDKGRGMASISDIAEASLIHTEEPYAAIIFKHCRDSYCSYCLSELPLDKIPCSNCSIPLFCSDDCQVHAGGQFCRSTLEDLEFCDGLSGDVRKHISEVMISKVSDASVGSILEHKYECGGVNWPAVMPPEIVLAGRILVKSILEKRCTMDISNLTDIMDLCHSYANIPSESKLEFHIYSVVLLHCLLRCSDFEIPTTGLAVSQVVILLSQIRVNSLAIVRIRSMDFLQNVDHFEKLISVDNALSNTIEQVRVGQGIYKAASLFNHSCLPNIHAYFLSRTILIRTTEFVQAGCPLELSYGPQLGQWNCKDRLKLLEEEYSFQCHCCCCSRPNFSDLVINAFRCVNPICPGVVLDSHVISCEQQKINHVPSSLKVNRLSSDEINQVTCLGQSTSPMPINPGICLKCGESRDLLSSQSVVNKAWICIKMLQDVVPSRKVSSLIFSDALRSLDTLRSTLHAYNRSIAEAEDMLAQAFCMVEELKNAWHHCKASIVILEKLYGRNHIVIGNELLKAFTIQLLLRDHHAVETSEQFSIIFSRYYGPHACMVIPYLEILKRESRKLAQRRVTSS